MKTDKKSDTIATTKRTFEISGLTKLSKSSGKISLECEECGMEFETYACWAKRYSHHYCSHGCASKAKERSVVCQCAWCGKDFETIPSYKTAKKLVTCSEGCESNKKSKKLKESPICNPNKGEKSNLSKLTNDVVLKIRVETGSQKSIAIKYGVSQSLVSQIKSGKVWGHI